MIRVRISPTIANEYATRCPEGIPEHACEAGVHEVSLGQLRAIHADAAYNSDPQAFTIGPDDMPLATFNAYRALAKQCAKLASGAALAPVALPPGPFAAMDAKGTAHAHTDAAHAVALVESTGSGWVAEFHGATACLKWAYEGGEWWLLDAYGKNLHQQKPT